MIGQGPNKAKPILDTKTNREYRSMGQAGRALAREAHGDPMDRFVWYNKVLPELTHGRFRTKKDGVWVGLDEQDD